MKSFYLTDAGMVRDHNEDSVIIVKNDEGSYLLWEKCLLHAPTAGRETEYPGSGAV